MYIVWERVLSKEKVMYVHSARIPYLDFLNVDFIIRMAH